MKVEIMNVTTFYGQYVRSIKVYFLDRNNKEGGIELNGSMADIYQEFGQLRSGDIIDVEIKIEKKEGI